MINNYYFCQDLLIGEGSYGKAYFGVNKEDFCPVAVKEMPIRSGYENYYKKEASRLKKISENDLFPKMLGFYHSDSAYYIIEDWKGLNMKQFLDFYGGIDKKTLYNIGIEIIINLKVLHEMGYLHVDLKEDNIASIPEEKNR